MGDGAIVDVEHDRGKWGINEGSQGNKERGVTKPPSVHTSLHNED